MRTVKERPESGQFVAVWEYGGEIWGQTSKVINGELYTYNSKRDKFQLDESKFDGEMHTAYILAD